MQNKRLGFPRKNTFTSPTRKPTACAGKGQYIIIAVSHFLNFIYTKETIWSAFKTLKLPREIAILVAFGVI